MQCIQCLNESVRYKERTNPQKTYCSRLCHWEHYLIGLNGNDQIVGLKANDDTTHIVITIDQAREMKTIDELLQDVGPEEYIPLPSVSGDELLRIQQFFQTNTVDTSRMNDDAFIGLMKAADYLDFERLLYHLMPEWVNTRPFPGPIERIGYVEPALYFYKGDFSQLNIQDGLKNRFLRFSRYWGDQWAIVVASEKGHLAVVDELLKIPSVNPAAEDNYAIRMAAGNGHLDVVERLLQDDRVNIAAKKNFAIRIAAENGHLDVVHRLLQDERVDPTAEKTYAIRSAAANGHLDVVNRLLQDKRVDPAARDNYAIRLAAENGHLEVVNRLLQVPGVDPTEYNNYAIKWAARKRHLDVVERLLRVPEVDPEAIVEFTDPTIVAMYEKAIQNKRARIRNQLSLNIDC